MPNITQEQVDLLKNNHYKTLGVSQSATDAEIKTAFRKLALKHHPDRHSGSNGAEATKKGHEEFIKIKTAYDTLTDASQRASYDSKLRLAQALNSRPSYTSKASSYNASTFFTTTSRPTTQPSYSYFRKPSTTFPTTAEFEASTARAAKARADKERQARERLEKLRRDAEETLRNTQAARLRREREKREQEQLRKSWEEARKRRSTGAAPPEYTETGRTYENPIPPGTGRSKRRYDVSEASTDGSTISDSPMPDSPSAEPEIDPEIEEQEEWEAEQELERKREQERQRIRSFRRTMQEREDRFKAEQAERERAFKAEQDRLRRAFERGEDVVGVGTSPRQQPRPTRTNSGRRVPIVEDPPSSPPFSTRRPAPTSQPSASSRPWQQPTAEEDVDMDTSDIEEIDPNLYGFPSTSATAGFSSSSGPNPDLDTGSSDFGFGIGGGLGGMGAGFEGFGLGSAAFPVNLDAEIMREMENLKRTQERFLGRTGGLGGLFGL
ncbi:DnaJ-domain-containing protein [Ascobolus immersus RN42]|uniref:DnaJ-domain-containing protein n=1 Tax=Ascobolus immersus RN42 TaxID=1160509 RepID=A0A3N4HXL6_ASCIM|nr:DnaJ-domain-containing protein [Ascobolus immersus RN42]